MQEIPKITSESLETIVDLDIPHSQVVITNESTFIDEGSGQTEFLNHIRTSVPYEDSTNAKSFKSFCKWFFGGWILVILLTLAMKFHLWTN